MQSNGGGAGPADVDGSADSSADESGRAALNGGKEAEGRLRERDGGEEEEEEVRVDERGRLNDIYQQEWCDMRRHVIM